MKSIKNKVIYLVIILIIFLSLTSINAADINNTQEDNPIDIGDFSTLSKEFNTTSQNINLNKDYIYDSQKDSKFSDGIDITADNLVIDGQNHSIDANKKAKVFNIKSRNVTLKNINIINGYSNSDGGAVYFFGTNGTIINSSFKNCTSDKYGGAVSFKWSGTVINSRFEDNKAGTGGGVDFGENGEIINSTFQNNTAKFQGGAISFYGIGTVKNSTFIKNTGGDGGTIYADSECFVVGSSFIQNCAIGYGAGIYFMSNGNVNNTVFTQNTALLEGGAIIIKAGNLNIFNSEFNYNVAQKGISLYITSKSAKMENLTFSNENTTFNSEIYIENSQVNSNNLSFNNKSKTNLTENSSQKITKKKTIIKFAPKTYKDRKSVV